ncbi:MAG TPA: hypothetical protein VFQ91_27370 [Bryobacteraceae bacterium]|nr:hypothetical protein [Bryobacteraceae bacterium]
MADLLILAVDLPGVSVHVGGFVVVAQDNASCVVAFRRNWTGLAEAADAEILSGYEETLQAMCREVDLETFLRLIETQLANTVRFLDRVSLLGDMSISERSTLLRQALLGE